MRAAAPRPRPQPSAACAAAGTPPKPTATPLTFGTVARMSLTCIAPPCVLLAPRRHPERGSRVMGSVDERRTPPTVGCQTRSGSVACTRPARDLNAERPGAKKRSSARVFRWGGSTSGSCCEGSGCPTSWSQDGAGEKKTQLGPGLAESGLGKTRKRPAFVHPDADGRDLRPARVEATAPAIRSRAAGAPNWPERRTCLQQAGALRPGC